MTTGKTITLSLGTFLGKIMSLFFNKLSRFVIAFLPRRKHLLISWLQSLSAVILKPEKINFHTLVISPFFLWSSSSRGTRPHQSCWWLRVPFSVIKNPQYLAHNFQYVVHSSLKKKKKAIVVLSTCVELDDTDGLQFSSIPRYCCCSAAGSCLTLCGPVDCVACRLLCPWDYPREESWSGLPFPSPLLRHMNSEHWHLLLAWTSGNTILINILELEWGRHVWYI